MLYLLRQLIVIQVFGILMVPAVQAQVQGRGQSAKPDPEKVAAVMKKAEKAAKKMSLPVNIVTREGLRAAKQTADFFHSPKFHHKLQCEQKRLAGEVFGQYTAPLKKKRQTMEDRQSGPVESQDSERIFLFISSSMPDETVQAYIATVARISGPAVVLVMRGVVGGLTGKKGIQYFSRILKKDLSCRDIKKRRGKRCPRYKVPIEISGHLFAEYGITRVPAVVYTTTKSSLLIQGDAGLAYLLARINRQAKSTTIDRLLAQIRGH